MIICSCSVKAGGLTIDYLNTLITEYSDLDLIFLGEAILHLYNTDRQYVNKEALNLESEFIDELKKWCRTNNINLSFGLFLKEHDKFYNAQILINRKGSIQSIHKKKNLTAYEQEVFTEGDRFVTYTEVDGYMIATSICYDLFHTDAKKSIKKTPHDLLLHSLADPLDPIFATGHNGRLSSSYYLSSNRYGEETNYFNGHIGLVDRAGKIIEVKSGKVQKMVHKIDKSHRKSYFMLMNNVRMLWHLLKHREYVINYLKWNKKQKKK